MFKGKIVGIVMAMEIEIKPFVSGLGLNIIESKPFVLYGNNNIFLVKCGVGRVRAAAATVHLINSCCPDVIINAGTAGANRDDIKIGSIYNVTRVLDRDMPVRNNIMVYELLGDEETAVATLVSSDRPSITVSERASAAGVAHISDMEASSVVFVANRFNIKTYIYKIISDSPRIELKDQLMNNIKKYSEDLFVFLKERFFDKM